MADAAGWRALTAGERRLLQSKLRDRSLSTPWHRRYRLFAEVRPASGRGRRPRRLPPDNGVRVGPLLQRLRLCHVRAAAQSQGAAAYRHPHPDPAS